MNVIVVGGGQVGASLVRLLCERGDKVTIVELRPERVEHLAAMLPDAVYVRGSGSEPQVLEAAGVRQAAIVAAVTGADEVNLVVTTLARFAFGVRRTLARVNNPENAWLFTAAMGVDSTVNQADLMAHLIAAELSPS